MRNSEILDWADCNEFRVTLQASPPRIIHGAATLLAALTAAALAWASLTQADLVVRAPGRIRPVTSPMRVVYDGASAVLSAGLGGRVVEVSFQQGQEVQQGDVLIRLDTSRLDNDVAKLQRMVGAREEELEALSGLQRSSEEQYVIGKAKAEAELDRAFEELARTKQRWDADLALAELELHAAQSNEEQMRALGELVSRNDLRKAAASTREAEERRKKVRLPVDERQIDVLRQNVALVEKDYGVRQKQVHMERGLKRAELEAARIELANLELQRQQAVFRAPIDGVVTTGDVKAGDIVESGKPMLEIATQRGFRFEVAVPSDEVGDLRVGMPARIKLDAYDYQRYGTVPGTVLFISADSELGNGDALYLVRIALARDELARGSVRGRVKLGMTGQAEIVTGQESVFSIFVRKIRHTVSLG